MTDVQIVAELPSAAVIRRLAKIVDPKGIAVHIKLHEAYARRFNEGVEPGFNWSGCMLHNLWWEGLEPDAVQRPAAQIRFALEESLYYEAVNFQGSGWVALSFFGASGATRAHEVFNHEYPWDEAVPLALLDMWEHAYVGKLTDRPVYVRKLLELVNWTVIERRLPGSR